MPADFASVNPATGAELARYPAATPEQTDAVLAAAARAQREWAHASFGDRARVVTAAAGLLRERRDELAGLATAEMGKPLAEARAELDKCAGGCDYFAAQAEGMLADLPLDAGSDGQTDAYASFLPLGIVYAVMPWNFPYWQVFRFAAPALMAGDGVVLKHAENVLGCAQAIADVLRAAGAPDGLFTALHSSREDAAEIIRDPRIAAVTLTGSTRAGASVAATAGEVIKKQVLELGGSDYFIVLDDADIEAAAKVGVRSRFQNCGQSCIAAKRFIVTPGVAAEFTAAFVDAAKALVVGDPTAEGTTTGPMARRDLRDQLNDQVERSLTAGGVDVLHSGDVPGGAGFYHPVVVARLTNLDVPLWREEVFGPVAPITQARDAEHAVALANDSDYGLGGNLWTADLDQARALARRLESGGVFVNGMTASDPRLPFGGVKRSGYGRELSAFGIREFVNVQTVRVGPPGG